MYAVDVVATAPIIKTHQALSSYPPVSTPRMLSQETCEQPHQPAFQKNTTNMLRAVGRLHNDELWLWDGDTW